jgi:hypothetical protein
LNYTIELSHTTKVRADFGGHFNKYFFPKRHALQRIDTKIGEFTPVNTPVLAILPAFRSRQKTDTSPGHFCKRFNELVRMAQFAN